MTGCRDASAAPERCAQYPIPWSPPENTYAAAEAELAALAPGADLTWNDNTGTLRSALALDAPLTCASGQDVGTQVFDVIAAHPHLFQLDPREWRLPEPYDCRYLGDFETLSVGRRSLAGRPVEADVFAVSLRRIDGVVRLTAVQGTYLPVIGSPVQGQMAACNTLTQATATSRVRARPLQAAVYSQCARIGTARYTPRANDTFQLSGSEAWTWQEGAGEALLSGQRTLRIVVNPANYTPELLSSSARCPALDGDGDAFTVGFEVVLDVHTGAVLSVKPGLDCVVC